MGFTGDKGCLFCLGKPFDKIRGIPYAGCMMTLKRITQNPFFFTAGIEAVRWSAVVSADAADTDIMNYARGNDFVDIRK